MLATIPSATLLGVEGHPVAVEVHVSNGLPGFTVVGLPDAACRESRDRVRAALLSSSLPWPIRRVTVNLAPSGIRKHGAGLDLAVALGLLAANGDVPADLDALVDEWAAKLAAGPTIALSMTKTLLNNGSSVSMQQALEDEARCQIVSSGTSDIVEAMKAFVDKREPHFEGR